MRCNRLLRGIVPLLLAFLALPPLFGQQETRLPVRRLALVIGANDGGSERIELRYAVSDAMRFASVMEELGGVDPRDSYVILDPQSEDIDATAEAIRREVSDARNGARRVEFLLYYSGHSDEQGLLIGEEVYTYRRLREQITHVDADVSIAVLDSCNSGSFTRLKGGRRSQPFLLNDSSDLKGHAFLTSSSDDEASQESDRIRASFFTHYLVSGLLGAADSSGDRRVTLNEVYQYAFDETLARTSGTFAGPQHPSYNIQLTGAGDLVLTDLSSYESAIHFPREIAGRIYVHDAVDRRLVAEASKREGSELTLAVPPNTYVVDLQRGAQILRASTPVSRGRTVSLNAGAFQAVPFERTTLRGGGEQGESDVAATPGAGPEGSEFSWSDGWWYFSDGATHHLPLTLGVVPGVRLWPREPVPTEGEVVEHLSVHLLVGEAGRVDGIMLSPLVNLSTASLRGYQGSYIGNMVRGSVWGFQHAGVYNLVDGGMNGVQLAGVFNILDDGIIGGQAAGAFNMAGGTVRGVQAATVFNLANRFDGLQAGTVNIAGSGRGLQAGVINISRSLDGVPLGLINVISDGIISPGLWFDEQETLWTSLQLGNENLYTLYSFGFPRNALENQDGVTSSIGLGTRIWDGTFILDVDLSARYDGVCEALFPSARGVLGLRLFEHLIPYIGYTVDMELPETDMRSERFHSGDWAYLFGERVKAYPQLILGVNF
ncbi:MAG: caspase domain-containing protein [Spirochaetaceae bacterium]